MPCLVGKSHVCCTRIENLSVKAGGEYILKDINLHLHCGELTAIVGRNGAGKTTILNMLGGMDTVTEGDIKVRRKLRKRSHN